ncbi:MAG: elongation factor P [Rhodobacteraceae bacterium]|nr:elongation factor P [Paracoccaceae bacterium]
MAKINGNEVRPGYVIEHNGGIWSVAKVEHVKPGKGGAFAQTELRNLRNGSKLNERFRSADKVERIRLEQRNQQFLYEDGDQLVFMDSETFDQAYLQSTILGDKRPLLQEGMSVVIEFFGDEALNLSLPQKVPCIVTETEPVISGQTAANSFKPALLDNGLKISVPPFIGTGDTVIVNSETMEYSERG